MSCFDRYDDPNAENDKKNTIGMVSDSRVSNNVGEIFSEKRKESENVGELAFGIKDFAKKLKKRPTITLGPFEIKKAFSHDCEEPMSPSLYRLRNSGEGEETVEDKKYEFDQLSHSDSIITSSIGAILSLNPNSKQVPPLSPSSKPTTGGNNTFLRLPIYNQETDIM